MNVSAVPFSVGANDTSKSLGTAYQAGSDLIVTAYMTASAGNPYIEIQTDSSNPPTTYKDTASESGTGGERKWFVKAIVRKGEYYKATLTLNGGSVSASGMYVQAIG